jgi:hypothetical protein
MEGELKPLVCNAPQELLGKIEAHIESQGRLQRLIILKARRQGMSTDRAGKMYWKTTTTKNRYAVMVTHEPEATDFLFGMHKRFYENAEWKPEKRYSNRKILEFNKADGTKGGMDSAIRVGTAGKEDFGSSQLIHYLHLSEVAKWPTHTATSLLTSILQCVPDKPDTMIVFESTAKGIGGEFHERYTDARYVYTCYVDEWGKTTFKCEINPDAPEENDYNAVFLPWFVFPDYTYPAPKNFQLHADHAVFGNEVEMKKLYNLTNDQLMWRRRTIVNKCKSDPKQFMQEYPSNAEEAFQSSGYPAFDSHEILKKIKACKPAKARYECQMSTGNFVSDKNGRLHVWGEPVPGREYAIGADVSEGIIVSEDAHKDKYDFSSADVVDLETGKQVAHWHGYIDPDQFGELLCHLGKRYNTAWLAPERNNHGLATVLKIIDLKYPKVYVEKIPDPPNKPRKRFGWLTSRATRPVIIRNLQAEVREGTDGIQCKETLREMLTLKRNEKGEYEAEAKTHDDRVISYSITKFIVPTLPRTTFRTKPGWWTHKSETQADPPVNGWL